MLKAEGKGLNRHITFCLFCCHIFYKSIIYLHTKKIKTQPAKQIFVKTQKTLYKRR